MIKVVLLLYLASFCHGFGVTFYQMKNTTEETPFPRENFVMVRDPSGSGFDALLWGGNTVNTTTFVNTFYNDLWLWEMSYAGSTAYTWHQVEQLGAIPTARSLACWSLVRYQANFPVAVLAAGGTFSVLTNTISANSDTLYVYNSATGIWTNLTSVANLAGFTPRSGPCCASTDSRMFIFGGRDNTNSILNEMWEYDLGTGAMTSKTAGATPRWLCNANMINVWQNRWMAVFGGVNSTTLLNNGYINITESDILNDMYQYNPRNDNWTLVALNNAMFPKRARPMSFVSTLTNQIYSVGGQLINNSFINSTIPVFNPNIFNISYTNCPTGAQGFTLAQVWAYKNPTKIWRNQTVNAITQGYAPDQFIPPVVNAYVLYIGQAAYLFGGIMLQCPYINILYNIDVTRIQFLRWQENDFII